MIRAANFFIFNFQATLQSQKIMKYYFTGRKIRKFFFPIFLVAAVLASVFSLLFFQLTGAAQPPISSGQAPRNDEPLCFIETTKGQLMNLEQLCGASDRGQVTLQVRTLRSSQQVAVNLQWLQDHPTTSIAKAPSPYSVQGMKDFDKILYGD